MNKSYMFILCLLVLSGGCSGGAGNPREFESQKEKYAAIVEKLENYQKIDSVEPALKFENVLNSAEFDQSTVNAYFDLSLMTEELGLRKVVAIRNLETHQLLGVSFVMPMRFLDWSSMKQIKYVDSGGSVDSFLPPNASCAPLDPPNWHFCTYDTQ